VRQQLLTEVADLMKEMNAVDELDRDTIQSGAGRAGY
jgi:hypothetical protein